jgi:hypothetical protein
MDRRKRHAQTMSDAKTACEAAEAACENARDKIGRVRATISSRRERAQANAAPERADDLIRRAPSSAPTLTCPACDASLTHIERVSNGAADPERRDRYACNQCGSGFDYHHNTRQLQRI